jgi:hypothetical protein
VEAAAHVLLDADDGVGHGAGAAAEGSSAPSSDEHAGSAPAPKHHIHGDTWGHQQLRRRRRQGWVGTTRCAGE